MFTQILANVLYAVIAAGMLFQIVTVVRYARRAAFGRRPVRTKKVKPVVERAVPAQNVRRRQRDYRLALRAARASVAA